MGMVEPSMTRTDQTDTDRTDLLPTRTYVVPDIDTTEDIEPTDTKDTFTPPTKVTSETISKTYSSMHTVNNYKKEFQLKAAIVGLPCSGWRLGDPKYPCGKGRESHCEP